MLLYLVVSKANAVSFLAVKETKKEKKDQKPGTLGLNYSMKVYLAKMFQLCDFKNNLTIISYLTLL